MRTALTPRFREQPATWPPEPAPCRWSLAGRAAPRRAWRRARCPPHPDCGRRAGTSRSPWARGVLFWIQRTRTAAAAAARAAPAAPSPPSSHPWVKGIFPWRGGRRLRRRRRGPCRWCGDQRLPQPGSQPLPSSPSQPPPPSRSSRARARGSARPLQSAPHAAKARGRVRIQYGGPRPRPRDTRAHSPSPRPRRSPARSRALSCGPAESRPRRGRRPRHKPEARADDRLGPRS